MFDYTRGSARVHIQPKELESLLERGEGNRLRDVGRIVFDSRRRRPLYFDGRFLDARTLTQDQTHFLTRQADLGRAGGAGVVQGLMVQAKSPVGGTDSRTSTLQITPGHGVTPSGELVLIPQATGAGDNPLEVNLADLAGTDRLNAAFLLSRVPHDPPRNRSGLFIVALRAVEFTANPIASYPTSIDGPRSVEDGDVVEATAVTLIPYPDDGTSEELDRRRARVAREIFVAGGAPGMPVDVLPLAMVALRRGIIEWVDPFMVRREVGAEHGAVVGFGFAPRAQREAHLQQHTAHFQEVKGRFSTRPTASQQFLALPPAGPFPRAAIDPGDFTQTYFPPEVDVSLSFVPEDEIPALIEESLTLPPIDLTQSGEALESTSVLVLIPVPRDRVRGLRERLTDRILHLTTVIPGLVARRRPLDALRFLGLPAGGFLPQQIVTPTASELTADDLWRQLLQRPNDLWYVRRRDFRSPLGSAGIAQPIQADEREIERDVETRIGDVQLVTRWRNASFTAAARAAAISALSLLRDKPIEVFRIALESLLSLPPEADDRVEARRVRGLSRDFGRVQFGDGLARLITARPELMKGDMPKGLGASQVVSGLDEVGRLIPDDALPSFVDDLVAVQDDPPRLALRVTDKLKELRR